MSEEGLRAAEEKMRRDAVPDPAIATFAHYYEQLEAGESGLIGEDEIEPVRDLPDAEALPGADAPLDEAVVIKLNGGLGTSMGMSRAKSLLEVKEGLSFLDVIARQVLSLREASGARIPLVLMNSFHTRDDSLALLEGYEGLASDVPFDFVQHKEPKLLADGLAPAEWPADPSLEWCPPGHGDIYPALLTSGMLATLLERGYRYAFMSNADNLGAVLDPRILAWVASEGLPYVAEVTERTPADRKGGHVARLKATGGLILRETAQTSDADMDAFTDVDRHPYFHVNNLWVDLRALDALLRERDGVLGLPMIVNEKTVDPVGQVVARRLPAGDGDGGGDRRVRRRAGDPRAARAVRAGEEDERPAGAAVRRLPARRARRDRAGAVAVGAAAGRALRRRVQAARRLRRPLPGGGAVAGRRGAPRGRR